MTFKNFLKLRFASVTVAVLSLSSCADFVEIDPPRTDLIRETVFTTDDNANAAALDLYYQMSFLTGYGSGGVNSITFLCALSSDEVTNRLSVNGYQEINENEIQPVNTITLNLWSELYSCIYKANALLEGLRTSGRITNEMKAQLIGEARFFRAFSYFYLVNLWGDVPVVLSTNYEENRNIGRSSQAEVYALILNDIKEAQELLLDDFSYSQNERTRINKGVATALLARVFLYMGDWTNAESQASALIDNISLYSLPPLEGVFLKGSPEAIFQLPSATGNPYDRSIARIYTRLRPEFTAAFESEDMRKSQWIDGDRADKYKSAEGSDSEYSMVFRLAEQYLIRAEARAQLGDIEGGKVDLNVIRSRAGLPDIAVNEKIDLLQAIEDERQAELFLEWGHRWLDLKRTARADAILDPLKVSWESTDVLYPIPEAQILNDPAMNDAQNPGYE